MMKHRKNIADLSFKKGYAARKIYYSGPNTKCGHTYRSFFIDRIREGICGKCRNNAVPENQLGLFGGIGRAVFHMFEKPKGGIVSGTPVPLPTEYIVPVPKKKSGGANNMFSLFFHYLSGEHGEWPNHTKFIIEYEHPLSNGKIAKCPYSGCTKKYRIFYCKCGKEIRREEYKF